MKISIKIKLALIISILFSLIAISMGLIMTSHQRVSLEAQMRSMALTISNQFARESKVLLLQDDRLSMNLLVQNILNYPGITKAFILGEKMEMVCCDEADHINGIPMSNIEAQSKSATPFPRLISEDENLLSFASPIIFKETTVGYTVIYFSKIFINEKVDEAIMRIVVLSILVIPLMVMISLPLSSGLLRPLFNLLKGTYEIAMGNLWYRIPPGGKDEVGELIRSFNFMASELEKKAVLKGAFNRYVCPHVADEILNKAESIHLGGERRDVTVLFSDIRGFTSLSRKMEPEEVVELLNRYFSLVTDIIFAFEGTVDKFIGDAVMAVFGSPIRMDDHLERAIKSAAAINMALGKVNLSREKRGEVPLAMGIGLDSGPAVVGNMGSKVRMEYTAIGDTVNVSSRLAGLAGGGEILLGRRVYETAADHLVAEKNPPVQIKGIDQPMTLYNLIDLKGDWKKEMEDVVEKALASSEREWFAL